MFGKYVFGHNKCRTQRERDTMRKPVTITLSDTEPTYVDPATATRAEISAALPGFQNPRARGHYAWCSHLEPSDHRTKLLKEANSDERNMRRNNRPGQVIVFH
jgi:hypothetical protein